MKKITGGNVLDVISYSTGIIIVEKVVLPTGKARIAYRSFDLAKQSFLPVTMGVYLLNKFGTAYQVIAEQLTNTVLCDTGVLYDKRVLVLSPDGEAGLFTKEGQLYWSGDFQYHDKPARAVAVHGKYFWCAVPETNSIVQYNSYNMKVHLRIGSETANTFTMPASLSIYENDLYVCNPGVGKVRAVDLKDYSVRDFKQFEEPVFKYFRVMKHEFTWLESGVYLL